ncbi:MAG: hypothetical protein K9M45_03360 [Kiritimatiellales bacterium]|nr:hypothetical protein [Kiritimatiellales bacterium]
MNKKSMNVSGILVILGLVFIASIGIRTISNPDIWTHLAQGRTNAPISILESENSVNTTLLYDKLVYGLWTLGGATLLILFNTACALLAFVLLLRVARKWGGAISQGFALLIAGQLLFPVMDVNPQTMMMLFVALFIFILSTVKKYPLLWATLVPLQIIWTHTHGSFLFGPFIVLLASVQASQLLKFTTRKTSNQLQPGILSLLAVVLLILTFFNPYMARLHVQVVTNVIHPHPVYWTSLFRDYFSTTMRDPLIFFVMILGAGGLITLKKRLPFMITTLAIIGAFLVVRSIQSIQLFAVLTFPFVVLSFTAVGEYIIGSMGPILKEKIKILHIGTTAIFILMFALSLATIVSNSAYFHVGSASSRGFGIEENLYPAGADEMIGNKAFPTAILNMPADGGYLAWKHPERKIFLDYRPGKYDPDLLNDFNAMLRGDAKAYDSIMVDHKPEAIILNTLPTAAAGGLAHLLRYNVWKLAYFDGTTAILLRNRTKYAPLLNNTAIQQAGLNRIESARKAYAEQINGKIHTGKQATLIGAGKVFLAFNRPAESKAIFELLTEGNPDVPGSWLGLGNSLLLLKEYKESVRVLEKAAEMAPKNPMVWISLANACRYAEDLEGHQRALGKLSRFKRKGKPAEEPANPADTQEETEPAVPGSLTNITIPETM